MGIALVTLPDGRRARVTFDTQEQLDATVADLTKGEGGAAKTPPKTAAKAPGAAQPSVGQVLDQRWTRAVNASPTGAIADAALAAGSGVVGSVAGGLAGIGQGAYNLGAEGLGARSGMSAADRVAQVQGATAYTPRSAIGAGITGAISAPFKLLGEAADVAGRKTAEVTGSPVLGAGVNTGIQALPMIAGAGGAARAAARAGEGESAAAAASRGTAAEQKAASYARSIGLDWTRVAAEIKDRLTAIARESGDFSGLDPEALKREALLKGLRVPVTTTRAKLTRSSPDLRREAVASKTDAGEPIRQTDIRANRDIQANLEILRGRKAGLRGGLHDPAEEGAPSGPSVRAPTKGAEEVGRSVQGSIRAKAKASKARYDALYKKARETEPDARVSVAPLHEMLEANPEIQHLGFMQGWLSRAARTLKTPEGEVPKLENATLKELHDLREKAGGIARAGGTDGYYAGQVVRAIDKAMEEVPEGAKAWKAANKAYREHQAEFKDQGIIKKLVTNKAGDRSLALEKTAQTIAKGSIEQIRQVKRSLLTGGDKAARFEGRRAWRDLQGETVNRILEDARNVVATDEAERQVLTAAALRKGINAVGRDRLTEILGKSTTDELYRILRAAKITRTEPAGRVTESGTVPNALVLAEKHLAHYIPFGNLARGVKEGVKSLTERGKAAREVDEAVKTPLQSAAEEAERRAAARNAATRARLTTLRAARDVGALGPTQSREP